MELAAQAVVATKYIDSKSLSQTSFIFYLKLKIKLELHSRATKYFDSKSTNSNFCHYQFHILSVMKDQTWAQRQSYE